MVRGSLTHRCVVAAVERETCSWVTLCPEIFPPVGRSGRGDSKGGLSEKIFGSRGDLMTTKDSRDEGGVVGVRYDH